MNKKVERYEKKAKKLVNTIKLIGICTFVLGIVVSISQYIVNNLDSRFEKNEGSETIKQEEFNESGTGTTYYISRDGTSSDGTNINDPMSLSEANKKNFEGNDRVLFKSGDIFYGIINFSVNKSDNSLFYIGSYGDGEKPIISGANILKNRDCWEYKDGLYQIDLSKNGNFYGIGNFGNITYNIGFLESENGTIYGARKKSKDLLIDEYDFYCEDSKLYIKCNQNPTDKLGQIKLASRIDLVRLSSNTLIENIDVQCTGAHGIVKKNSEVISNVIVRNCVIQNIGGSVQIASSFTRYGNGLEFWDNAENTLVEKCIFKNTYDAGYTMQGNGNNSGFENNVCRDNIFINCTYTYETFCRDQQYTYKGIFLRSQKFLNNLSIDQGRGWGYNVRVDKEKAGEMVLWAIPVNDTDIEISNNIFYNSRRVKYKTTYTKITDSEYKKCILSDNNKLYLSNDTKLLNDDGDYYNRECFNKLKFEVNSDWNILNEAEMDNIENKNVFKSNNYEFIKKYYELFEDAEYNKKIEFGDTTANIYIKNEQKIALVYNNSKKSYIPYTNYKATDIYGNEIENNGTLEVSQEPILIYNLKEDELYNNIYKNIEEKSDYFIEKYKTKLDSKNLEEIRKKTEQIKEESKKILELKEPVTNQYTINLIEKIYQNGESIINVYKENNNLINNEEVIQMLSDILDISVQAEKLLSTSKGEVINYNKKTDIEKNIKEFEKIGQFYNEAEASSIYKLENEGKEYYKKIIPDVSNENDLNNIKAYYETLWAYQLMKQYDIEYIKNNPVTIDYSETNPTNQNVTATLRTNAQITINNNSNSKAYTFTQNGTFTFDYTIKGQTFQQTATVNNIDKTAPTIGGVENDRLYLSEVTPKATDTNLKEVLLYKDNNQVQNYQQNTQITEDGHYKLIAKDSAGNQTSVEFDISRNPAIIDYSEVNLTNQDVVATVNSNFDVNVKNNSNQKSYTFKVNGEFTFELNIKGAELQLTAKVDNIDKTPPTITDVEDKKQYIDKVTPKISDDNLNEVKLYFDSEEVQGYAPNSEITGEGFYKLVAKDLAGNETSVEFIIIENPDEKYQIKDGNILNIKNNTNQDTFRKKLKMSGEYSIYRNDTLISDNDKIATGDKLRKSTGEEYTLIVSGDINNDGDVNIKDIVMLRKYLLERNNLDENSLLAADCNLDGKDISIKDLIRMRLIALERDVN